MLVQWMATLRCGLRCEHCLAVSRESGFSDMPLEAVHRLIDGIAQMGVKEFLVTGGEPLAREDLGEVIEHLGRSGVSWTLNTAVMPTKTLREVLSRNKPGFVAVSLDGPKEVHDAFRGRAGAWDDAMEAIRFFKSLDAVRVCAGTTVTSRNYDYLDETFHLVTTSGADQWGIHLLVPEGRAADRPDLFLSKTQLKRLIKFVARRRRQFHVQMADEIGYLGYLEPLVRDVPLTCGAGRAQCVVLPDGSVVPCTTLDRSCSAGNVHDRPLQSIWTEGFADLRQWRPNGKCGGCEYAVACKGGCWLQRKAGTQCFKEVWHVAEALKTAAGIAICLGSLAVGEGASAAILAGRPARPASFHSASASATTLESSINDWYFKMAAGLDFGLPTADVDWSDPGWAFFKDLIEGTMPQDITGRCARVVDALETQERSLSLVALLWRGVNGPLFEADPATEYSQAERQIIRDTLGAIKLKAQEWRLEIFEQNLDPYLAAGRVTERPFFMYSKAGPRKGDIERHYLSKDVNEERWGIGSSPDSREAAEAYLRAHHYADQMDLRFAFGRSGSITKYSAGQAEVVVSHVGNTSTGTHLLGVFDVIATDMDMSLRFEIRGDIKPYDTNEAILLGDGGGEQDIRATVQVNLTVGREYTYVELIDAIYRQGRSESQRLSLLCMAYDWLSPSRVSLWDREVPVMVTVHQNAPLLWPAFREIIESDTILPTQTPWNGSTGDPRDPRDPSPDEISQIHRRAVLKDTDFWMF
ncbi:MAG: radical SAM protein [Phycisphaerae bacterium]|nr:radical SAM protein [Phycisphaerae bacterium]